MILAPNFPLQFDDTFGYSNIAGVKQLVFFHLKNLLFTNPGEKISDPEYGVGVRKYLFEQMTDERLNNISTDIVDAIEGYLSYLELQRVMVTPSGENAINISVQYSIPSIEFSDILSFNVEDTNY